MKPSSIGSDVSLPGEEVNTRSAHTSGTLSVSVGFLPVRTLLAISLERTGNVGPSFRGPLSSTGCLFLGLVVSLAYITSRIRQGLLQFSVCIELQETIVERNTNT